MSEDKLEEKVEELADAQQKTEPVATEESISESMRLKKENDAMESELLRKEELRARSMNAGTTTAGKVEKTKEDIAREEAARILSPFDKPTE